jgi:DNA primase catalytic core
MPEAEIERLKKEISLERLVAARGVELRRHGKDLLGHCPFHDDRDPSLVVSPEKNLWHCLGACQTGGSVIDWVMKSEGVSFRHAVEFLRNGSVSSDVGPPPQRTTKRKLASFERDAEDHALLLRVVDYYHRSLKESPEALGYLASRGLKSAEMVEHFRLGFANRTLGYRLPQRNRKEGKDLRDRLERLGILRESGHEHFNGCIVVPIFDEEGRVTGLYGRRVQRARDGAVDHLYLAGGHRGVWNLEALRAQKEIILCEALFDALTFWCAGYRNVTASYGIEGFTDAHRDAFRRYGTKTVRIAYDRDDAGDRAAEKLSEELNAAGIETYRVHFPKGMDANEYAQKVLPAEKSLGLVLRKAEWMGKGKEPERPEALESEAEGEGETADEVDVGDLRATRYVLDAPEAPRVMHDEDGVVLEAVERDVAVAEENAPAREESEPAPSLAVSSPRSSSPAPPERDELVFRFGERRWRVRGLGKNLSFGQMRVNIAVWSGGDAGDGRDTTGGFFVDTLDVYGAKARASFTKSASGELSLDESVVKRELGQILLRLEQRQEEMIEEALRPKKKEVLMSEEERREAMRMLRDPRLLDRVCDDFQACGVVGEDTNKLVGYLAAVSRKLEQPLAVVIQSSSAAGKSSLMDAVLSFVPEEERLSYSAMTGQSLYYMGHEDLRHKVLAIVEEAGAERASYALKLLQSEGELSIASTGKDPTTGKLVTHTYKVSGPVQLFLTTTAITIDEELLNRCLVLAVDEGAAQTKAIHDEQRRGQTLEGLLAKSERERIRRLHQNAQRLLHPLLVVNPLAHKLTFPGHRTRTRRDHMKYLTLIRAVALLHQHQREIKTVEHRGQVVRYIEATRRDVEIAQDLADAVLGRGLEDLPPGTRKVLELVEGFVRARATSEHVRPEEVRFSRREVREALSLGDTQLKVHLRRLEELEYVVCRRGDKTFRYELALPQGAYAYDEHRAGPEVDRAGVGRPPVGPKSGVGRGTPNVTIEPKPSALVNGEARRAPNALKSGVRVAAS